ncbi:MAG: hypothetical protein KAW56_15185 [Candidatus Marinimicrobia bacterium]|nr:hypothetical protein [Candidatus Neomarinimicrobiota bacterium]
MHPIRNIKDIQRRLDQVDFFFKNYHEKSTLKKLLSKSSEIERLLSRLRANIAGVRELLALKITLKFTPDILKIITL